MGKTEVLNTIVEQITILTETIHSKDFFVAMERNATIKDKHQMNLKGLG